MPRCAHQTPHRTALLTAHQSTSNAPPPTLSVASNLSLPADIFKTGQEFFPPFNVSRSSTDWALFIFSLFLFALRPSVIVWHRYQVLTVLCASAFGDTNFVMQFKALASWRLLFNKLILKSLLLHFSSVTELKKMRAHSWYCHSAYNKPIPRSIIFRQRICIRPRYYSYSLW